MRLLRNLRSLYFLSFPLSLSPSFLPSLARSFALQACAHANTDHANHIHAHLQTQIHNDLQARENESYEASRWREDGDVEDVPVKPTSKIAEDLNIKGEGEPESKKKSLIRSLSSKEGVA